MRIKIKTNYVYIALSAIFLSCSGGYILADEPTFVIDGGGATVAITDDFANIDTAEGAGNQDALGTLQSGAGGHLAAPTEADLQRNIDCIMSHIAALGNPAITSTSFGAAMSSAGSATSVLPTYQTTYPSHNNPDVLITATRVGQNPYTLSDLGVAINVLAPSTSTTTWVINLPELTPGVPALFDATLTGSIPWLETIDPSLLNSGAASSPVIAAIKAAWDLGFTGYNALIAAGFTPAVATALGLTNDQARTFIIGHEAGHVAMSGGDHLSTGLARLENAFTSQGTIATPDGFAFEFLGMANANGVASAFGTISSQLAAADPTAAAELNKAGSSVPGC